MGAILGEAVAALLRRRIDRLAVVAVARLSERVARRWAGYGVVLRTDTDVRLLAPRLRRRRRGGRDMLADPALLWPGVGGGQGT
jgi:hypothetical protein